MMLILGESVGVIGAGLHAGFLDRGFGFEQFSRNNKIGIVLHPATHVVE